MKLVAVFKRNAEFTYPPFTVFSSKINYLFTDTAAEKFIRDKVYGFFCGETSKLNIDSLFLGEKYRKAFAAVKIKNKGIFHNGMTDKRKVIGNIVKARPIIAIRLSETFKSVIHGGFDLFAPKKNRVAETAQPLNGSSDIFFCYLFAFLRAVKNHKKPPLRTKRRTCNPKNFVLYCYQINYGTIQ